MTILRDWICRTDSSPYSAGATSPRAWRGAAPSSCLTSPPSAIWQLYLIMMVVELTEYWRNYIAEFYQCFLKLFNNKELLGNPKQFKRHVNCTYKVF